MGDRGYGESWKALDRRFKNRVVMLKFLRAVPGVELPEDLSDHINSLRALKHSQVLAVVGHGLFQSTPFLVHEYFEGRSLGAGLDEARETGALLPLRLLEALFAKVAAAVSAAHQATRPLIHGGLNPGCVVIHRLPGEELQVRVLDFGLHRYAAPDPSAPARSARALLNLAPEQFEGATPTEATDVFGLGALLREMVSSPPEMGATLAPTALHRRRPDVPLAVWETAGTALQSDPSQRFATIEAFLAEVQQAWQQPVDAAPPPRPDPAASTQASASPSGPRSLFATQHHDPQAKGTAPSAAAFASPTPYAPPAPFREGPALQMPSLPNPAPPVAFPAPVARPVVVQSVENYAATMVLSDLPADSNPWDLSFKPEAFAPEAPRARSMSELMRNIQRSSSAPTGGAAPRPTPAPIDATMALDESDLGATIVDSPSADPPSTGRPSSSTMLVSDRSSGFGQMPPSRPVQTTMPLVESSFGAKSAAAPLDATMVLPEPSSAVPSSAALDSTAILPGTATPFPARAPAPAWTPSPPHAQPSHPPSAPVQAPAPAPLPYLASPYLPPPPPPPREIIVDELPHDQRDKVRLVLLIAMVMGFIAVVVVVGKLLIIG